MSTKYGKIQIVGAEREANQQVRLTMRSVRSPHDAETIGAVIEAVYPAQASVYWLDDLVDQNFITRDNSGVINCTNESSVMENIKREAGLEASEGHIKTRGIRVVAARSEVAVDIVGCAKSQCCKGKIGQTLADVTFAAGITENTCDQNLSCTSCAVLLPAQEAEKLPTPSAEEQDMIEQATEWFDLNQQQTKGMQLRLACQVRLSDDLAKKGLKIFELGAQG
jgi:ferredoxin